MKISNIISVAEARASSAAFRSSNTRRGELNAMSPEERKAHDDKRAEQQRKRDDARLERERAKNVAEATMTPDQIAAARAAAPYGYNGQTGKPNPAPAGTAPAVTAKPAAPTQDPNTLGAIAAAKAGKNPTEIMLAQPHIANNQQYLDSMASAYGLPAGSTVDQIKAAAAKPAVATKQPAPAVDKAAIEQKAIDDIAVKQGLPAGLTKEQFFKAYQDKINKQWPTAPVAEAPGAETLGHNQSTVASNLNSLDLGEGNKKPEQPEADYGDDYQAMVSRVKKLAGMGPLKTVYDPAKRVYKNMPTAVQPKK